MNKTIELVNAWGVFESKHPTAGIEEFCRYYLAHSRANIVSGKVNQPEVLPPTIDGRLMRLLGRIFKLHAIYTVTAIDGSGLKTIEEYSLLNVIYLLIEPRKTEAIYSGLYELSTGTDMLSRLKKLGYITEHNDIEDKRSKRLKVTTKGEEIILACRKRVMQLAEMMFHDLTEDDKFLCFQLLESVESKFSGIWQSHKGKNFDDIYEEITAGSKKTKSRD